MSSRVVWLLRTHAYCWWQSDHFFSELKTIDWCCVVGFASSCWDLESGFARIVCRMKLSMSQNKITDTTLQLHGVFEMTFVKSSTQSFVNLEKICLDWVNGKNGKNGKNKKNIFWNSFIWNNRKVMEKYISIEHNERNVGFTSIKINACLFEPSGLFTVSAFL